MTFLDNVRAAKPYIIAEAGSNHDGDLDKAYSLIDLAAAAQADAVKFQLFRADKLYAADIPLATYLKDDSINPGHESISEILTRRELPESWLKLLAEDCRAKGIDFLCTPFHPEAVGIIEESGVPAIKIASSEVNHWPLLEASARTKLPIILSTGMATKDEIAASVKYLLERDTEIILMHCNVAYPAKTGTANLNNIPMLAEAFGLPVGFSDHTIGNTASIVAAALGAVIIEKHITISKNDEGPDHKFAMEGNEFKEFVVAVKEASAALGVPKRIIQAEEEELRRYRAGIVSAKKIAKGTPLTEDLLTIKRPAFGIDAFHYFEILGRFANRDIEPDNVISWDDLT